MQQQKIAVAVVACALTVVACATEATDVRTKNASTAERSVSSDDSGVPSCPNGGLPLCTISNLDLSEGGPRPSDQCVPLVVVTYDAGQTSFTWSSPSGQLVDGVLVRSGTTTRLYTYDPAVSADPTALASPTGAPLTRITFCGTLGAHAEDAGTNADASGSVDAGGGDGTDGATPPPTDPPPADGGCTDAETDGGTDVGESDAAPEPPIESPPTTGT